MQMYGNSGHNSNMMRRSNSTVKTVALVVAFLLFMYGLYAYHDLHGRLKRSDEKSERLRQQHDSLSAQLQVVYEQKSRLDKLYQQEKSDHKQSKDDLSSDKRRVEEKFMTDKQELLNRVNSINSEHKLLEQQHEDLQEDNGKLHDQLQKFQDDYNKLTDHNRQELTLLKQEADNNLQLFKDQTVNLERRNLDLQQKLNAALQHNQISQKQIEADQMNVAQLQEKIAKLQGNLMANVPQQQQQLAQQQPQQQLMQQQQLQQQQQPQQQQQLNWQAQPDQDMKLAQLPYTDKGAGFNQINLVPKQQYGNQLAQDNNVGNFGGNQDNQGQQMNFGGNQDNQLQQGFGNQGNQGQWQNMQQQGQGQGRGFQKQEDVAQQNPMQVMEPGGGQKPYFDPKEAQVDHEVENKEQVEANIHGQEDQEAEVQHQQVIAPKFENNQRLDGQKLEILQPIVNADINQNPDLRRWGNVPKEESDEDNGKINDPRRDAGHILGPEVQEDAMANIKLGVMGDPGDIVDDRNHQYDQQDDYNDNKQGALLQAQAPFQDMGADAAAAVHNLHQEDNQLGQPVQNAAADGAKMYDNQGNAADNHNEEEEDDYDDEEEEEGDQLNNNDNL